MRSAVLSEDGFEIREVDKPTISDDEILIRTIGCGVCSGDLHIYRNRAELVGTEQRLGHEGSGSVVEVGKHVTGVDIGDIVTALGKSAYAEYFIAKPAELAILAPEIDPLYALGEAIGCCVHAGNRFGTRPGDRVALVGCGFMGLICLQLVRYQKAGFVLAIDPFENRLEMSRKLGADAVLSPFVNDAGEILRRYGEFDVVIEAAGTQSAIDLSTQLVKKHGRIILVGYHQSHGGLRTVNMQGWNYKAIDVVNGHVRRRHEKAAAMRQGMELMRQGHIVTKPLATSYNLADTDRAFQDLASGATSLFKAVLFMDAGG